MTFTAKLLRALGGMRKDSPQPIPSGVDGMLVRYDPEDIGEAVEAVKAIAFAIQALDFDEGRELDAVAGWLLAPEHGSAAFKTHEAIGSLARLYLAESARMRARVRRGSFFRGGMRCREAHDRLAELAGAGAAGGLLVWLTARLMSENSKSIAGNDNGRSGHRRPSGLTTAR